MKTYKELTEELGANTVGSGNFKGLGSPPDDFPPVRRKVKKPDDKFMGCPVFKVTPEEYQKCMKGKGKYERYAGYIGDDVSHNIKGQVKKTGAKSIIVQNDQTGEMSYLFRR